MIEPHLPEEADLVQHNGYHIRLSQSGLDWMAFVARPKQRPTLILAPDREAALAKAYEWIDRQRASNKIPE